jgi:hypothetical protein
MALVEGRVKLTLLAIFDNITPDFSVANFLSYSFAQCRNTSREEEPMMEIIRLTEALALAILLLHKK